MTLRRRIHADPEVRAALLVSEWAQAIGLTPGNLWEPALLRHVLKEWRTLGADASAASAQ